MLEFLLPGLLVTIGLFLGGAVVATAAAFGAGLMSRSSDPIVRAVATAYIELFRGTSLLVQLFWFAFALPLLGLRLPHAVVAVVIPGLNIGAYGAVVVRSAIEHVPRGQLAASTALGLTPGQRLRHVVLPQAFVAILPTAGNLLVELLKATALVSTIFVGDLMRQALFWRDHTGRLLPALTAALLLYFLLGVAVRTGVGRLERRAGRRWHARGTR